MRKLLLLGLLVACASAAPGFSTPKKYNTAGGPVEGKINVMILPHTHDDVGWLKTVDQYYMGANNSIQHAGVQYILDSVVQGLLRNPDRKFTYVEMAFFSRWWYEQSEEMKETVRGLVKRGQLSFANGAWSMHDEACAHFVDMVDQTSHGHAFLAKEFGVHPRIGWQIDPFGHSAVQASLLSAEAGFDALYFARIDYQDRQQRWDNATMEMLWRASPSLGVDAQVFTGVLASGYGPPSGFCFDAFCDDLPMQDDPRLHDVNIAERVDDFVAKMIEQNKHYRTDNILLTMGSDFQYENANEWFKNLDKLIHYVNLDGRVNAFYANLEMYTDAKHASSEAWTVKTDDFFPYSDSEHAFWTGYFTSRAGFKKFVRDASGYHQSVRQLLAATKSDPSATEGLAATVGIVNHHDGVSGTEKQHVAYDYAERLAAAQSQAQEGSNEAARKMISKSSKLAPAIASCTTLNVSICAASEEINGDVVVIAYNPLGQARTQLVHIPIDSQDFEVENAKRETINSTIFGQFAPSIEQLEIGGSLPAEPSPFYVSFEITLPPFSFDTFYLVESPRVLAEETEASSMENEHLVVEFDAQTGFIKSVTNKADGVTVEVSNTFHWYNASVDDGQQSGAYIFRPNNSDTTLVASRASLTIVGKPGGVLEARQQFSDWVTQIVRLAPNAAHLEFEWTVGPVPIDNGMGKEVISRFTSNINSGSVFYTDSNGRDVLKRTRDHRDTWTLKVFEPVAGNFYPVNAFIALGDDKAVMTVLVDRSEAGSSLRSGEFELMVQRRLLADDSRGVGEPLNETLSITHGDEPKRLGPGVVIRGTHYLVISAPHTAAERVRTLQGEIFQPDLLYFGDAKAHNTYSADVLTSGSLLNGPLPKNVNLMTLQALSEHSALVRFAHSYGVDEHDKLSANAKVSIADMFKRKVVEVTELTLTATRPLKHQKRLLWKAADGAVQTNDHGRAPVAPHFEIELTPLKIRTFEVRFE